MPETHKRVKLTTECPELPRGTIAATVDGKPLLGVTSIKLHHDYSEDGQSWPTAEITLIGVDVDLEAIPDYAVRVVGPKPKPD